MRPSLKQIIQAHKVMGFSDSFITKIKKSEERRLVFAKKVPRILEKIFDREPVKKVKRKEKEKPKPVVDDLPTEEPEVEPDPEENNTSNEDCTMDVEPDQEDEEVVEDEYFSEED
jgi:hypothetical protein